MTTTVVELPGIFCKKVLKLSHEVGLVFSNYIRHLCWAKENLIAPYGKKNANKMRLALLALILLK